MGEGPNWGRTLIDSSLEKRRSLRLTQDAGISPKTLREDCLLGLCSYGVRPLGEMRDLCAPATSYYTEYAPLSSHLIGVQSWPNKAAPTPKRPPCAKAAYVLSALLNSRKICHGQPNTERPTTDGGGEGDQQRCITGIKYLYADSFPDSRDFCKVSSV